MKDLQNAMLEEQRYLADKFSDIDTSLSARLAPYGYATLAEYFTDKQEYLFNQWKPEVYPIAVEDLTLELEKAVQNGKYGIYISVANRPYAFHGSDEIDYELCEKEGVYVAELYHRGGTIIGNEEDFGIEIIAPIEIGLTPYLIITKFYDIIHKYEESAEIAGNDILVNGEKVLGSMSRCIGSTFVWAAQVSFGDYNELIEKICNKKSAKKPGRLKHTSLNKKSLEKEVLKWLLKL